MEETQTPLDDASPQPAVHGQLESQVPPTKVAAPVKGVAASPILLLLAGLVGSAAAWIFIESSYPFVAVPEEILKIDARQAGDPVVAQKIKAAAGQTGLLNAGIVTAVAGLGIGCLVALGEGAARRSWGSVAIGVIFGALAGAVVGFVAGVAGHWAEQQFVVQMTDRMQRTIGAHAVLWGVVGLAVGLVVGVLSGRAAVTAKSSLGALLGGVLAAIAFCPLAAIFFQQENTDQLIPEGSGSRLMWLALAGGLIGLMSAATGKSHEPAVAMTTTVES